jgi:hypothetical protein
MRLGFHPGCLLFAAALTGLFASPRAWARPPPRVWIADDGVRIARDDLGSPLARGDENPIWRPDAPIRLRALRDEVVAFQVLVEAGDAPLERVEVAVQSGLGDQSVLRFVEHYVNVHRRSGNDRRPHESLGWSEEARPIGMGLQGALPDALIPVDLAPPFSPYPMSIKPRQNGAVWVDISVPRDTSEGRYTGEVVVTARSGELARIPLELEVSPSLLPYRAVSFLAYYNYGALDARIGNGERAERQLFQLLHQHHVDALASLSEPEDADRLRPALDGSLFTATYGYRGPGYGVAPAAVALGAYGALGEPSRGALRTVETIVPKIPEAVRDVVLYAVDEDCESPLGPRWRRLISGSSARDRVRVAHSCSQDPRTQDVDLVLVPANRFRTEASVEARKSGREVWVYNGALPRAGPLLLDADVASLRANGWIAAFHDVGRWFLWETTFWNDDNKGGRGPINPFVTAESFHNKHGDTAFGDGLLLYPGTERGRFSAHSLGYIGVIPSMRLKNLRRGIEDAGYVALARAAHPVETDAIVAGLVPAALDELDEDTASQLPRGGARFAAAREALRALIPARAAQEPEVTARVLHEAAESRRLTLAAERRTRLWLIGLAAAAAVTALVAMILLFYRRVRRPARATVGAARRSGGIDGFRDVQYAPVKGYRKPR